MFSLSDFTAEINTRGVLKNNRYEVNITGPKSMKEASQQLTLRCETAQLPGMTLATIDGHPRLGYGPVEANPYGSIFDTFTLTFIVDNAAAVHKYFYDWVSTIVNFRAQGQNSLRKANGPVAGMVPYEVGYKENYSTTITITVFAGHGESAKVEKKVMDIIIYNAYPLNLPTFDLSWHNTNDVVKLPISFSHTDFEIKHY